MTEPANNNTGIQESRTEILLKITSGEYWLLRREERRTVWHLYRQIVRSDGSKLRNYYFCTGCKRLMASRDTSSLRSHICHVKYLQERANAREDLDPKDVPRQKNHGHRTHWTYKATKTLLQLWEDNLEHLQNGRQNQARIFRKIAKEFNHLGLKPSDIKIKIDSMSDRYRTEAERMKVTGRPSKWYHFQGVEKLLIDENNALEEIKRRKVYKHLGWNPPDIKIEMESLSDREETKRKKLTEPESKWQHFHGVQKIITNDIQAIEETKHWKDKRLMAIQEERLALEREQIKNFKYITKVYHKNLLQLLSSNE